MVYLINPFALSLSKGFSKSCFGKLGMNGKGAY